jgi:hypothetical protein
MIDFGITNVDAKSQQSKDPHRVLEAHKREEKEIPSGL